ncbi:MAG: hypothetical protein HY079_02535 [Elusimicrobia bacterium]|nr:hypothetical protein [Elusimicrobiota bacterium]
MRRAAFAVVLLSAGAAAAAAAVLPFAPERRRAQFRNDPGYAILPYAYSLPGIGVGYGVLGAVTKWGGGDADALASAFTGDADGEVLAVHGLPIVRRRLIVDAGVVRLSRTSVQSYALRGMDTSKDDYILARFGESLFGGARVTLTSPDRQAEAFAAYYAGTARLESLRDRDGDLIASSRSAPRYRADTEIVGVRLDLTDDYQDPRRGLRLEPNAWRTPPVAGGPEYVFTDLSATAYVPLGRRSTWAFNALASDSYVLRRGVTDPVELQRRQGFTCDSLTDAKARAQCSDYIANMAAMNAHGTATMLGGFSRLRAYPEGRYKGAHARFLGTELRWNLTDEFQPFDIYVMRDIRTAVQVAFFYELGTVADAEGGLWKTTRSAGGAGLRVITASGLVYRFDLAAGQEGVQPSVFFQYPWEL